MKVQINIGFSPDRLHLKDLVLFSLKNAVKNSPFKTRICDVDNMVDNEPLYHKYNFMQSYGSDWADYVMKLDGDNLVSANIFQRLESVLHQRPAMVGFTRVLLFDVINFKIKESSGDPTGTCLISSEYAGNYYNEHNRHSIIFTKVKEQGGIIHEVSDKAYIMDIKDGFNVWDYGQIKGYSLYS